MQRVYNKYNTTQVVYNNYVARNDELLALDNKLKTHQPNPSFMEKTYKGKNIPYFRRRGPALSIPNVFAQKYGKNSSNLRGSVLWNNVLIKF